MAIGETSSSSNAGARLSAFNKVLVQKQLSMLVVVLGLIAVPKRKVVNEQLHK
jgi:hypothetical protein